MNKKPRLNLAIDNETSKAIDNLKSKYAINISAFVRKSILNLNKKMESENEKTDN